MAKSAPRKPAKEAAAAPKKSPAQSILEGGVETVKGRRPHRSDGAPKTLWPRPFTCRVTAATRSRWPILPAESWFFFYPRADTPGCTKEAIHFTLLKSAFTEPARRRPAFRRNRKGAGIVP